MAINTQNFNFYNVPHQRAARKIPHDSILTKNLLPFEVYKLSTLYFTQRYYVQWDYLDW